jgi:flagellar hook protein FlgE
MGIFDALTTAVAGLQAQSFALQNISGNIANSQTTGYKETDTHFEDLVSDAALGQQTANGVIAGSRSTNTVQGTIQSTAVSTDMAINGNGWFVVAKPVGTADNQPVFSGVNNYTRAGDFQLNSNGNLVNGAGYYLMGIPLDPQTGNPVGSSPQVLKFTNDFVPAQATTAITYQANLPSKPSSGLLVGTDFQANPLVGAPPAATIVGSGAKLSPDAAATGTGTVNFAATSTALGLTAGQTITINDGINPLFTYTATGTDTIANLMSAINAAHTGNTLDVTAALSGGTSGDLVLTGTNGIASITVGGTASADSAVGFGAGNDSFQPTNLITQGAVAPGDTMTISVNGTPTTITFGTTGSDVATLAQLQAASASAKTPPTRPPTRSSPTTPRLSPPSRSMAVRSPPMTPSAIRSTCSFAGRKPAPAPGSCFIKAIRTLPAPSRCGRTSARFSTSIRAASSRPRCPVRRCKT